ncbi:MAG: hypothetical protein GF411_01530 [Candidatus Lokiarchaeota archaeon]|nr:hypothetical protein [Candidatus Lokiarchaeota archaeon]
MAEINLVTVLFQLLPALISTLIYLIVFRSKRNRYVEAFLAILYIRAVFYFLWNIFFLITYTDLSSGLFELPPFASNEIGDALLLDFIFHFASALQDFLTWVMVAFFAVLFGMLVLAIKLALQDPIKRKFSNVIKRVIGREPETDGFSGFRDRIHNVEFDIPDKEPLNPEVISKAYSESWKDYLIIGLATLLPSIGLYMSSPPSFYAYGIIVFLTWIYRFGYPSSNRLAKGAGLTLGNRKIGDEMMRGVLGWFFRLNLLLSIGTILLSIVEVIGTPTTLEFVLTSYAIGFIIAFPPILFAIVVFPLVEDFAIRFYKRTFEALTQVRSKVSSIDIKATLSNYGYSVIVSGIGIAAYVGAIFAVTLHYSAESMMPLRIFPENVESSVANALSNPTTSVGFLNAVRWILLILLIPFCMILFLGVVGHFVRKRIGGEVEGFAIIGGLLLAIGTWLILPGLDYILNISVGHVIAPDIEFLSLRPTMAFPTEGDMIYRYLSEFLINVPLYIFGTMFVMHYLKSSDIYREKHNLDTTPLVNVHSSDVRDVVVMFVGGLIISVIGIAALSLVVPPGILEYLVMSVLGEIGDPNGLEFVFGEWTIEATGGSIFPIILEHNLIRTLLMLLIGPIFWSLILWLIAMRRQESDEKTNAIYSLFLVAFTVAAGLIVSFILLNGVFVLVHPWSPEAFIGLIVGILLCILFGGYFLIWIINKLRGTDGGWWFPPLLILFVLEYFVYDDQFTLIALIILPMIIAILYKVFYGNRPEVQQQDTLLLYIKFSLMSLAISEVLSTALTVGGLAMIKDNPILFWAGILPHFVIEIPAFLFIAAASLRIARDLSPSIMNEEFDSIPEKTRVLLTDGRVWRTYILGAFFLGLAALVETEVSGLVRGFVERLIFG